MFRCKKSSKIVLYDDLNTFKKEISFFKEKNKLGSDNQDLSMEEAKGIEPAIESLQENFVGAIYSKSDEVGDTYLFCKNLYSWLLERNTSFLFNSKVTKINKHNKKISSIVINSEELDVETVVICAGIMTDKLVKISSPIMPVKGYSLTLPKGQIDFSKSLTLTDKRMLFTKIGNKVRVTGFADFIGTHNFQDKERILQLFSLAKDVAPHLADYNSTELVEWAGVRPLTPTSFPVIGPSNIKGVYVNSGQGFYGWTLACASGARLAEFFR